MRPARLASTQSSRAILPWVLVIGLGAAIVTGLLANFLLTRPPIPEPCTTEALARRSSPTPLVSFGAVPPEQGNPTIRIVRATGGLLQSEYRFSTGFNVPGTAGWLP